MDETSAKVQGAWVYLYRAVDSAGNTLEFLLSAAQETSSQSLHGPLLPLADH